jgi:rubrerythrin
VTDGPSESDREREPTRSGTVRLDDGTTVAVADAGKEVVRVSVRGDDPAAAVVVDVSRRDAVELANELLRAAHREERPVRASRPDRRTGAPADGGGTGRATTTCRECGFAWTAGGTERCPRCDALVDC